MDVTCVECGKKGTDGAIELVAAGWVHQETTRSGRAGWVCPACVVTIPSIPRVRRGR
ncbi:MAG TPA: hypothetical protein VGI39_36920 [Polyangiaceae bacterium]|jgi:hypothetical protein